MQCQSQSWVESARLWIETMARTKKVIDKDALFWWRESSVKGTLVYEAMIPLHAMPICSVWARWSGNATLEILQSFTIKRFRRMGYRTFLHNEIIKHSPKAKWMMTSGGNKVSKPWLRKMGFWKDEITNDWMLEINRGKKKQ